MKLSILNSQFSIGNISLCNELELPKSGLLIADEELLEYYRAVFYSSALPILKLKAGEQHKTFESIKQIYEFLAQWNATRSDSVHVFGGGTILDTAAFAVSTFKRGLKLWFYPTTLLAMMDAAIGGKTGYNFLQYKNLIGSFFPAERILIYPGFLDTLPLAERRQGLAEMLKLYLISPRLIKPRFGEDLLPCPEQILLYAKAKLRICAQDPFDHDLRQHLNLGHSFAHALESSTNFRVAHGDAVIWGIEQAAKLSLKLGLIDTAIEQRIMCFLQPYPMPLEVRELIARNDPLTLSKYMQQDKKNTQELRLILFTGYRKVDIFTVSRELIT